MSDKCSAEILEEFSLMFLQKVLQDRPWNVFKKLKKIIFENLNKFEWKRLNNLQAFKNKKKISKIPCSNFTKKLQKFFKNFLKIVFKIKSCWKLVENFWKFFKTLGFCLFVFFFVGVRKCFVIDNEKFFWKNWMKAFFTLLKLWN